MSNEQLDEFEKYFDAKDDTGAFKWLKPIFPIIKTLCNKSLISQRNQGTVPRFWLPPVAVPRRWCCRAPADSGAMPAAAPAACRPIGRCRWPNMPAPTVVRPANWSLRQ